MGWDLDKEIGNDIIERWKVILKLCPFPRVTILIKNVEKWLGSFFCFVLGHSTHRKHCNLWTLLQFYFSNSTCRKHRKLLFRVTLFVKKRWKLWFFFFVTILVEKLKVEKRTSRQVFFYLIFFFVKDKFYRKWRSVRKWEHE